MMNRIGLEKDLDRIQQWIRQADQKISIFTGFQGIVIAILFPDVLHWLSTDLTSKSIILTLLAVVASVLIICGFAFSLIALIPTLTGNGDSGSLSYFGDIAKLSFSEYKKQMSEADENQHVNDLLRQIHINAIICSKKHNGLRTSMMYFSIGSLSLLIIGLISLVA
jgi:hypothetical protein